MKSPCCLVASSFKDCLLSAVWGRGACAGQGGTEAPPDYRSSHRSVARTPHLRHCGVCSLMAPTPWVHRKHILLSHHSQSRTLGLTLLRVFCGLQRTAVQPTVTRACDSVTTFRATLASAWSGGGARCGGCGERRSSASRLHRPRLLAVQCGAVCSSPHALDPAAYLNP